jgi:hypothetical protein
MSFNTLESLINLKKAIKENKSKKIVKRKFTDYCKAYAQIKNPMKNDISDYKNNFLEYLRYMSKNGEDKR